MADEGCVYIGRLLPENSIITFLGLYLIDVYYHYICGPLPNKYVFSITFSSLYPINTYYRKICRRLPNKYVLTSPQF